MLQLTLLSGRIPEINSASRQGQMDRNQVARRIGQGKAIRPTLRSTRSRMMRAARSASMKNGIGQVLRSVMRERMNPGHTTFMRMPSRRMKVTDGRSLGKVYDPYFNRTVRHFCSHQYTPYETQESGYDAAVISGSILYFAHPVFSLYRATGAVVLQQFFKKALEAFLGDERQVISNNFPSTGRVTLMKQKDPARRIMHVLYANTILRGGDQELPNLQRRATQVEVIEELTPLRNTNFTVRIPEKVTSVVRQPKNLPVAFEYADGRLTFTIDEFTCHTMIEIR